MIVRLILRSSEKKIYLTRSVCNEVGDVVLPYEMVYF